MLTQACFSLQAFQISAKLPSFCGYSYVT